MFRICIPLGSSATGWLALTSLAAVLSGCAELTPHGEDAIAGSLRACMTENVRFSDAWGCIQGRYAIGQLNDADPRLKPFLKLGDDLARQVETKKLSDAQARTQLAAGLPPQSE